MKTRLTPYYIELVYDACLKSFWRKKALSTFLRNCGVSQTFIATWGPDETKRDFLDRLFLELPKSDGGQQGLLRLAVCLTEQRTFPDLMNWEDSAQKIKTAHDAIQKLKLYHDQQDEEIQTAEERQKARQEFLKRQADVTRSQQTLQKLTERLNELGQHLGAQQAGYDFQPWFYDPLDFSEIPNRRPYIHDGRQIDGSLTWNGTTYLVELKFSHAPTDPPAVGDFFKKVTTKGRQHNGNHGLYLRFH